jgi:hypothetical protein
MTKGMRAMSESAMKKWTKWTWRLMAACGMVALLAVTGCGNGTATIPALVQIVPPNITTVNAGTSTFVLASAVPIGVDWSLSGPNCSGSTCGTLKNATPTSVTFVAPVGFSGQTLSVTLTATSTAAPSVASSTTFTIQSVPLSYSLLNGSYAFFGSGWMDGSTAANTNRIACIGSFTADGFGNITAGEVDVNSASGLASYSNVTGTYTTSPNQTGVITLTPSGTQTGTPITLAISLGGLNNGIASTGSLIEYDDTSGIGVTPSGTSTGVRLTGSLALQDSSVLSTTSTPLTGSFAFGMGGGAPAVDANSTCATVGCPISLAGALTLTAPAVITVGTEDLTIAQTATNNVSLTGQFANNGNTDSYGRATASISVSATTLPSWPTDFIAYVISPQAFYIMSGDSFAANSLVAGRALQQNLADIAVTPFNSTAAMVMYANLYSSQSLPTEKGATRGELQLLTLHPTSATAGTLTGTEILNASGTWSTPTSIASSAYTVQSNGRVTIAGSADPAYLYLVDTNQGFATANGGSGPTAGVFTAEMQTSTSLNAGTYFFGISPPASNTGPMEVGTIILPTGGVPSTASKIAVTGYAYGSYSTTTNDEGNSAAALLYNGSLTGTISNANGTLTPVLTPGIQGCSSGEGFVISATKFACLTGVKSGSSYSGYAQVHIFQQ